MGGNAILGFLAVFIARTPSYFSWLDLAYWAVFASRIAVRYADVTLLHGTTGEGTRATLAHWRPHAVVLSLICAAVWVAAHALAPFTGGWA